MTIRAYIATWHVSKEITAAKVRPIHGSDSSILDVLNKSWLDLVFNMYVYTAFFKMILYQRQRYFFFIFTLPELN